MFRFMIHEKQRQKAKYGLRMVPWKWDCMIPWFRSSFVNYGRIEFRFQKVLAYFVCNHYTQVYLMFPFLIPSRNHFIMGNITLFCSQVRYQSRKRLAEQRPRVRGQFVRQAVYEHKLHAHGSELYFLCM